MRINELLAEQQQLDELSFRGISQGIGRAVAGLRNNIAAGKQAYDDEVAKFNAERNPPAPVPAAAPAPAAPETPAAPAANPAADQQSKMGVGQINKLIPTLRTRDLQSVKKNVDATIAKKAKQPAAAPAPAAQSAEYDPAKAAADKQAKGQADQAAAVQQMTATKQANAAAAQKDAQIKAAADAAKAKPPFQQTAQDKLAIKAAADKGIREAKKKKLMKQRKLAEFHSQFLNMKI